MTEPVVYLNGRTLPASQAHLAIFDAGVVMGATVTEMTRTFRHQPFRLGEHLDRLYRSLRYTRLDIGLTKEELQCATRDLIQHNAGLLHADDELGIVHFVTPGELPMYAGFAGSMTPMRPTVCIHSFPLPYEFWAKKMQEGVHLVTPSIRHVPPQCYDPKMKCRSRMHYYLADKEAQLVDPAASALLLDLNGNVTETSGANFLFVERGAIVAPPLTNTLPGVSRAMVIELARELAVPFVEREVQVFDVLNAEEAFMASTPYCLLPVTRVNGVPIGDGRPGVMFEKLLTAWSRHVGVDVQRQIVDGARRRIGQ